MDDERARIVRGVAGALANTLRKQESESAALGWKAEDLRELITRTEALRATLDGEAVRTPERALRGIESSREAPPVSRITDRGDEHASARATPISRRPSGTRVPVSESLGGRAADSSRESSSNAAARSAGTPSGQAEVSSLQHDTDVPSRHRSASGPSVGGSPASTPTSMPWATPSLPIAVEALHRFDPSLSADQRLESIREELGECQRCQLCTSRNNIVFGVGDSNARLMFIGEAPGQDEDLKGEPFVGKAGQLLTRMIGAMGLQRSDVYIANVIKCRPPRNRNPEADEVLKCSPFLSKQVAAIEPEVIVALGRFAFHFLAGKELSIMRNRGKWFEYQGVPVMPTLHPAYLLRFPKSKRETWLDLQQVMKRLGLDDPRSKA